MGRRSGGRITGHGYRVSRAGSLANPERIGTILAGDTESLVVNTLPDPDGFIAGAVADKLTEGAQRRLPNGADDVSTELRGILLDPTELERRVNAVAAVAGSFERAVASDADARPSGDAKSS